MDPSCARSTETAALSCRRTTRVPTITQEVWALGAAFAAAWALKQRAVRAQSPGARLTVILTTSPIARCAHSAYATGIFAHTSDFPTPTCATGVPPPRHPSTDLIDEILGSFRLAKGLSACDVLVVCDGYRDKDHRDRPQQSCKYRSGVMTTEAAARYNEYIEHLRLRERAPHIGQPGLRVLALTTRHGFGLAVRAGLSVVRTRYVAVVQHDRAFLRPISIPRLLASMDTHPWIGYLGLPTSTTLKHPQKCLSKYRLRVESVDIGFGLRAMPLLQFVDSTHLARADWYCTVVFGRGLVARGGFIEDKFGQAQLTDIRNRGVEAAHPDYGTFICDDGVQLPMVGHLDGHDEKNVSKYRN